MLHSTDYIVARNNPQYGDLNSKSSICGKTIIISYGGKTAKAMIVDACPECAHGSLDMSQALFDHFASEDKGVFQME